MDQGFCKIYNHVIPEENFYYNIQNKITIKNKTRDHSKMTKHGNR